MIYVACFAPGQESCTCLGFEWRQGKVGGLCKHIKAAKLDAGLDVQSEQVGRIRGRRSLALLNDDEEEYDRLTAELDRFGVA